MGSRLTFVSAVCAGVLASAPVLAQPKPQPPAPQPAGPGPLPSADVAKQGLDLYKAGDFVNAVPPLERAFEMEPNNFQVRFALAESLRQSGQCGKAVPHYKAMSENPPDAATGEQVRTSMALCPTSSISEQQSTPAPPPPPAEPVIVHDGGISGANTAILMLSGASLGAAVCLALAARWDAQDADVARSYDDHERLDARSTRLYIASGVTAALGITLGVIGIKRAKSSNESTGVSFAPRAGGGTLVLAGSW